MQRMALLRDNNAKLEVAVKAKDSTIKSLKENMEKQIKLTKDLNNKLTIAEENNKKIAKILAETDIVKNINLEENRFGFEPEITAKIAKRSLRIYEVGISYFGRKYADGKKIAWKDGFSAIRCILKYNLLR